MISLRSCTCFPCPLISMDSHHLLSTSTGSFVRDSLLDSNKSDKEMASGLCHYQNLLTSRCKIRRPVSPDTHAMYGLGLKMRRQPGM